MTAIFGLWQRDDQPVEMALAETIGRSLAIYGNDRRGIWCGDEAALGTSLSFSTPEDRLDRQPLAGSFGRIRLVADIRLDNRPELADMLAISPSQMRDMSDAGFVLAAWEKWQEGALDKLIGDWAIAVWDDTAKTLTLARDFMGTRPLFYRSEENRFAFASMAKGIHALPGVPITPDLDTLRDRLALLPLIGSKSFFAGVSQIEPGTLLVVHGGGAIERRVWYVPPTHEAQFANDVEAIEAFRSIFDRAVTDRLRAIGPIASHLSGGLDSSSVTASAALQLAEHNKRLIAYTAVPIAGVPLDEKEGSFADEWPHAHAVAEGYPNIEHVAVDASQHSICAAAARTTYYYELPQFNPSNSGWVNEIKRLAAKAGVTVLLTGEIGNATITRRGLERLSELFAAGHWRTWWREASAYARAESRSKLAIAGKSILPLLPPRIVAALKRAAGRYVSDLASHSALRADIAQGEALKARMKALGFDPTYPPSRDTRGLLRQTLMRGHAASFQKGDLAAFGIDRRDPTADRRLVEFALTLPSHYLLRDGETMWIFRQALGHRLPPKVLNERRKGFQAADWLPRLEREKDGIAEVLRQAASSAAVRQLIDTDELKSLLDTLPASGAKISVASRKLYRLKLERGLAVASFVANIDRSNGPTNE